MSEAKHTKGPWTTDEDDHDAPHQNIKVKAGKHHTVCTVWIDDAPVRNFNSAQQANARLIAAAPELLAALKFIVSEWGYDGHGGELEDGESEVIDKVRAAIAKAEGGAA